MNKTDESRRRALKQFASMTALGAVNYLRSPAGLAATAESRSEELIHDFAGKIIRRKDTNYEAWRQSMVWHHSKPDRFPDLIVQTKNDEDVIKAVKFAAANGHRISIHSGGHNSTGCSVRNDGMVLDVGAMGELEIDEEKKLAVIQPGVRSIQLMEAARARGLHFPVPHCPSVGLSGFTMGGGQGWNWGPTGGMSVFSIAAADIVTADGQLRHASPTQNQDLYWAVRGAGPGFFGVVTKLWLNLSPVARAIHASNYIIPLDAIAETAAICDELVKEKDDRVELINLLAHNPMAPPETPAEDAKICFVTAFAFGDTPQESKAMLEPMAKSGLTELSVHRQEYQPFDFEGLYNTYFSASVPAGMMARYKVDNVMTDEPAKVMMNLAEHFRKAPSHHAHVLCALGLNVKHHDDACFSSIATTYVGCYAIWDHEEDDEVNYDWLGGCMPLMEKWGKGHYVNEVEPRYNPDRLKNCFSKEAWTRLESLRDKYDPDGVFHHFLREG